MDRWHGIVPNCVQLYSYISENIGCYKIINVLFILIKAAVIKEIFDTSHKTYLEMLNI